MSTYTYERGQVKCPSCGYVTDDLTDLYPESGRDSTGIDCDECGAALRLDFDWDVWVRATVISRPEKTP